ncbi:alanine racemase [Friedmanniella endophytica]|uniref:Alanine racemase n=1 Tax=Microlunatus kandeliicorticis TaxID=1759536 RepID=A0A7W3P4T8_9ACTN|nr:alanine racemase [Microlunatus kandeliicorticis]MBA8793182.1 alanine racemase [Microlunatus kandeliicorticis]
MTAPDPGGGLIDPGTGWAEIDLDAFAANLDALRAHLRRSRPDDPADLMVVVKADGYGHGMVPMARAARDHGVGWLGVATPGEALALRAAGDTGRVLAWLYGPADDLTPAVGARVDLAAHSPDHLDRLAAAARATGVRARVHLKIDTGLSRNGCRPEDWPGLCRRAEALEQTGALEVEAVWSHLACADEPGHPSVAAQLDRFAEAVGVATAAGLSPRLRHLANSPATLIVPEAHHDLVRVGIAAYGVDPAPGLAARAGVTLTPVMTLRARLAAVKRLQPGDGVSYGHRWVADRPTTVGLVPLGYADGVPRTAGLTGIAVRVDGNPAPIRGVVCMDQFVVEVGPDAAVGDPVVLFGRAARDEPTAETWAEALATIGYELVTRVGPRVPRVPVGRDSADEVAVRERTD